MRFKLLGATTLALASSVVALPAQAQMLVQYYTVGDNNRDFSGTGAGGSFTNAVGTTLGPNGLPTIDPMNNPMNAVDYNPVTRELNWWSPGSPNITVTATGISTIAGNSFSDTSFYPTNGNGSFNGNGNGFQAAIFSGNFFLTAAQTLVFSVGADDDAFLFVDGTSALQNGGIHGATTQTTSVSLGQGLHSFKLFYADRQETGAVLNFSLPEGIEVTPGAVPEPATWGMMILGFGAMGYAMRRRAKVRVTSVSFA